MDQKNHPGYEPIENYGVIGNLHTVALVSRTGSVDYLPFMRIDSPTVFLKLLDQHKGGQFVVQPAGDYEASSQFYLTDTNILVTRFHTEGGIAEVMDFMPVNEQEFQCALVRQVKVVMGAVRLTMHCTPAFDYARCRHSVQPEKEGCLFLPGEDRQTALRLTSDVPLQLQEGSAVAQVELREGETCFFLLEAAHSTASRGDDAAAYVTTAFQFTYDFWKQWAAQCSYAGPWKAAVTRSMLVLKLLISHKYGAPVAAATFGLPEVIGGERNWDYRYTWTRDAAFTMYALMSMGYYDEADKFIEWIKRQAHQGKLQLVYAVDGEKNLQERDLPHLEGYRGSRPVRVGNGAYGQLQMDIYGELLDTVYIFVAHARPITCEFWLELTAELHHVVDHWQRPDSSIWEVRENRKEFLYTRLMCWVAMDRAIRIAERCSFPYPEQQWKSVRDAIYNDIFEQFWDREKESFVQYKGAKVVDASMLMMPLTGLVSPYSDSWRQTLESIEAELVSDVLVYRYKDAAKAVDRFRGQEGTFTICSFWYVECLARGGEVGKATLLFEKLLGYANPLGLYAEQIGTNGRQLGNFPQAFTHLSLISAAIELSREEHLRKKVLPPSGAPKMQ